MPHCAATRTRGDGMGARLEGKIAFITGACSGIGLATAELFIDEGARVLAADIQDEAGAALQRRFEGRLKLRALRRHPAGADPGRGGPCRGRVRRPGHRLQQRRRRRPARRHGGDDARRLGRNDEPAAALGDGRHDVRAAAPEGAWRRRHRQHLVDLGAGHRLRAGGLFHRQGGGAALQQVVRGRPGAPPHPRQRRGAGLHRHVDLRQRLRPGPRRRRSRWPPR